MDIRAHTTQFWKVYHKKTLWMILFFACTATIVLLSVIPYSTEVDRQSGTKFRWDYLEHFLAFFAFGGLYVLWRSDRKYRIKVPELLFLIIVSGGFSMGMEYIQLFIPGRAFNYIDFLYNLAGVLSSILLVYFFLIRHYIRKKLSPAGF